MTGPVAATDAADGRQRVPAVVRALWDRRRDEVVARIDPIADAVRALAAGDLDDDVRGDARRAAHRLAGALGMFGLSRGSQLARELEHALGAEGGPRLADVRWLSELVSELGHELRRPPAAAHVGSSGHAERPLVLLATSDTRLADRLAGEAQRRALRTCAVNGPSATWPALAAAGAAAVVIDLVGDQAADGLAALETFTRGERPLPVVTLVGADGLADRVAVARHGGRIVLRVDQPACDVLDALEDALHASGPTAASILAVDDDPVALEALRRCLEADGFAVTTLSDPSGLWGALAAESPDLVLLDVDMPQIDGLELCRVLRADARHARLPVLFLTGARDAETVRAIFDAGADDYVAKPIIGAELSARIRNRLQRTRLMRRLAERDPLTGVFNRRGGTEALERIMHIAARFEQPVSVALVDIDRFKQINDRLGHERGDDVLVGLGRRLLDSFRGQDVVARWGGEEFLIGMYGAHRADAVRRVAQLLEDFRDMRFGSGPRPLANVSFTAAVAEFPADGADIAALCRCADDALFGAKAAGRNRVVPARISPVAIPEAR